LPAKLTAASVMVLPLPDAWPGGLPCPWNRGTVDTVACQQATRGKRWSQRSRPGLDQAAEWARLGCRVGWRRLRLGVGHASPVRPAPSTLGVEGERGSRRESCLQLVPGCLFSAGGRRRWRRRYQHVMAGRDAAIAAALDELVRAASTHSVDTAARRSGTRVARTGQPGRKGKRR
jgi:hypothetical protein